MDEQSLLVKLLRNAKINSLVLDYDLNLGQSFFDEIADFVTVNLLRSYQSAWSRVKRSSGTKQAELFGAFELHYEQLPRQVVLQKPSCYALDFHRYSGFEERLEYADECAEITIISMAQMVSTIRFGKTVRTSTVNSAGRPVTRIRTAPRIRWRAHFVTLKTNVLLRILLRANFDRFLWNKLVYRINFIQSVQRLMILPVVKAEIQN